MAIGHDMIIRYADSKLVSWKLVGSWNLSSCPSHGSDRVESI